MKYDYKTLYQKNAEFYEARPFAKQLLFIGNLALPLLFLFSYGGFLFYAIFTKFDTVELIKLLLLPSFCLLLVMILRLAVDRPRPYSAQGANIQPLFRKKSKDKESFPSRHVACAFVIALVIGAYFPFAGIFLCLLAFALAYIRFSLGLHYPSDLFGGAITGALCALPMFII